jgi:single-strand DNA-binding protein
MAGFNRVILLGNLTRDPQLRYLPNNTAVCDFGLALNRTWRDRDGNQREEVCFVDCSAFARPAEVINQYMSKGRQLLVEGRLKFDTWTGQDGQRRSKLSVVVENFQFVGPREGSPAGGDYGAGGEDEPASRPPRGAGPGPDTQAGDPTSSDTAPPAGDDIPF